MKELLPSRRLLPCLFAAVGLLLLTAPSLRGQVTVDASSELSGEERSSFSLNHTVESGNGRLLLVSIGLSDSDSDAGTVASVSYAGQSLTEIASAPRKARRA